ncbi:MAG TPA: hypothetical protein PK530_20690, partial [Anaerolineales bacterium]|nr:hypothetical protein [Anaerolineales bacterium]
MSNSTTDEPATLAPSATITNNPENTATVTRSPTRTPWPTRTPTATSTPKPDTVWGDGIEPILLKNFEGIWSPTANQLVGLYAWENGSIALVNAPDFSIEPLNIENASFETANFFWSQDGTRILFTGPYGDGQYPVDSSFAYSNLWVMQNNGSNAHPLFPGETVFRGLTFKNWIDENFFVFTEYFGGGGKGAHIVDIAAGQSVQYVNVDVGDTLEPNGIFVPAFTCQFGPCDLFVFSRQQAPHPFPTAKVAKTDKVADFFFKDWLPGTNKMLLVWFGWDALDYEYWATASHLLLWDVDTDQVTSIAPGGVHGKFSENGQFLAFVTFGDSAAYQKETVSPFSAIPISKEAIPYIQIQELGSQENFLSLPIVGTVNSSSYPPPIYDMELAFSFDSRYFAFLSPGAVTLNDNHWPIAVDVTEGKNYLNLLDLQTRELIVSIPDIYQYSSISWSPNNDKLLYQDVNKNWFVYELEKKQVDPITQKDGADFGWPPAWSFDGRYLSFSKYT